MDSWRKNAASQREVEIIGSLLTSVVKSDHKGFLQEVQKLHSRCQQWSWICNITKMVTYHLLMWDQRSGRITSRLQEHFQCELIKYLLFSFKGTLQSAYIT